MERPGGRLVRELANGVGDPAPHGFAAVIVLRGEFVAARSAFLKGLVAVAEKGAVFDVPADLVIPVVAGLEPAVVDPDVGLFPRLRAADFWPVYIRLDWTAKISPVAQIKQALAENLAEHGVEGRPPRPDETLWGYFHDKETEFWSRRNRLTPFLVFDQFEEIFTLGQGATSAETLDELATLIQVLCSDG